MAATEIAKLTARPGRGDDLERQLRLGLAVVLADRGCLSASMFRGIEDPHTFVCAIEWTSVEAHLAWRDSPARDAYRAVIGDLEGAPIEFSHYAPLFRESGAGAPTG